jgi:addiction module RelB/DinJ family antitoxin
MEKKSSSVNVQIKLNAGLKKNAENILEELGMDLNTFISMSLSKLVEEKKIPFKIGFYKVPDYTQQEAFREVQASMSMEGFILNSEDMQLLDDYSKGEITGDEIRHRIIESL